MATLNWIKNTLKQRGVPFEECHHSEVFTAQEVAQREHISGHHVAKVVVVVADGQLLEVVLPASRRVVLGALKHYLGAHEVRLASEAELEQRFRDCEVGAMPALDHWASVPVIMDHSMEVKGDILLQGGTHTDAVRVNFEDWFKAVHPRTGSFSEPAEHHLAEQYPSRGASGYEQSVPDPIC